MPPSAGDICRQHLDFMKWADEVLLAAVVEHAPDHIGVMRHIYLGELVWYRRVRGEPNAQITSFEPPADAAALQNQWPGLHRDWIDWAECLADWTTIAPHRSIQGVEYHFPVWKIVLHLVNHGSYHRGQVSAMLRASGIVPPATDLIAWYRLGG